MRTFAAFSIALFMGSRVVCMAADAPTATPAPSPTPAAEKTPPPDARAIMDGLSQADLNEALKQLKANYINPSAFTQQEMDKATLQGLLDRLAPGAAIFAAPPEKTADSPFRAEILNGQTGYVRLGSLVKANLDQLDTTLQDFNGKNVKSLILDLRATPPGDFDMAATVLKRFCPKGKMLFTVKKLSAKQERIVTSDVDPVYHGFIVVLADKDTGGAGEVIAAVLRNYTNAMVVGTNTAGQSAEFADMPLSAGKILRVAVSEVVPPGNVTIFSKGVKPDIALEMPQDIKTQVMQGELDKGVSQYVFETERSHLNEAALVAGTNPDIDALQAAQKLKASGGKAPLRDTVIQRALDLITTIGVYETKPAPTPAQDDKADK